MILPFPSRFLKKLEIYQQIRSGQGIAKYKHLWCYESAFLQYSYEAGHQHLNSFVDSHNFKKWVQKIIPDKETAYIHYNQIIGNLFWRGFIEIQENENESKQNESKLITRQDFAISNDDLAKNYKFRITQLGHDVGEVISEINSKKCLLRYLNKYKYSIALDLFWLFVLLVVLSLFHITDDIVVIFNKYFPFYSSPSKVIVIVLFIFVFWPLSLRIFRSIIE